MLKIAILFYLLLLISNNAFMAYNSAADDELSSIGQNVNLQPSDVASLPVKKGRNILTPRSCKSGYVYSRGKCFKLLQKTTKVI